MTITPEAKSIFARVTAACGAALMLSCAYGVASTASSRERAGGEPAQTLTRPVDLDTWPTVGVTMRMTEADPNLPAQMRQVQMAPDDYAHFVEALAYPDGAAFAVTIYGVRRDATHTPQFFQAEREVAFAMEVIDRSHPDGRRFYVFDAGQDSASALPPGNECSSCHTARGSFDGTFAHAYPAMARRLPGSAGESRAR